MLIKSAQIACWIELRYEAIVMFPSSKKKKKRKNIYNYAIKYHITMASVEPAGMIPNLNRSSGNGNSRSWSAEISKQEKSNYQKIGITKLIQLGQKKYKEKNTSWKRGELYFIIVIPNIVYNCRVWNKLTDVTRTIFSSCKFR